MQVVQHNMASMFVGREIKAITTQQTKTAEKLSSGYRINRSADDAAGLSISEKMRSQIRGLDMASRNIQDGISFVQSAEGALNEVHSMLQRIRELAVQASNDTNTLMDREAIDAEVQQLKKEMNRVYRDAEFNKIPIFSGPVGVEPEIYGYPLDYELYNGSDGKTPAGVMINNKRYNWMELGVTQYGFIKDWEKSIIDPDNPDESITLRLKAGDPPEQMRRVYYMTTSTEGILINNVLAATWDDTIRWNGETCSFSYRGMDISFEADESLMTTMKSGSMELCTWDAIPSQGVANNAVRSTSDTMTFNVTNANKYNLEDWKYELHAYPDGIVLEQTQGNDGLGHSTLDTKVPWKNFSNIDPNEEAYPISDWGLYYENSNPVTMDSSATYRFTDPADAAFYTDKLQFVFNFLENEVSRDQVMNGLTQPISGAAVKAPIASVTGSGNVSVTSYGGLSFHFQRDKLLRDFGENGSSAPMNVRIERTMINDGTVLKSYQERKDYGLAYIKKETYLDTTVETYTGEVLVSVATDGSETEEEIGGSFKLTVTEDKEPSLIATQYEAYNAQNVDAKAESDLTPTESTHVTGDKIDGTETAHSAGEAYTYKKAVTYTVTKQHRTEQYHHTNGHVSIYGASHNYIDTDKVYARTTGFDAQDNSIPRGSDGYVYHEATGADTSAHYYRTGTTSVVEDKTYYVNQYSYTMYNSAGAAIMSGKSDYFVYTGSDPHPSSWGSDYQYIIDSPLDQAANAASNAINMGTNGALSAENVQDSIGVWGYIMWQGNGSGTPDIVRWATDLAVRRVSLSATYEGAGAYIEFSYNDKGEDANRTVNKTTTAKVTPNGVATRSFTKSAKTGGSASDSRFDCKVNPKVLDDRVLHIQAGCNAWQSIDLEWPVLTNSIVGISNAKINSFETSQATIDMADTAIEKISEVRSKFGAMQNRLEHAFNIANNVSENTQAAESRIRDTNMAKEMVTYAKINIISQVAVAMLTQANQNPQLILSLLR